jgi:hypothetical protein
MRITTKEDLEIHAAQLTASEDKVIKIYISIPISGHPLDMVKARARRLKRRLQKIGNIKAVTPFDVCSDSTRPYSYCMGRDIEALLTCDAVFFAEGYEASKGCWLEYNAAKIYGKDIIHECDDVLQQAD